MELGTPTFILGETHLTNRDRQHLSAASFEIVLFSIVISRLRCGYSRSSLFICGAMVGLAPRIGRVSLRVQGLPGWWLCDDLQMLDLP